VQVGQARQSAASSGDGSNRDSSLWGSGKRRLLNQAWEGSSRNASVAVSDNVLPDDPHRFVRGGKHESGASGPRPHWSGVR
jgi:hypothetical protein